ncbi:hypothetical protein ABZ746_34420 [Streptomyces sp. NPDC020096]
MTLWSVPIVAIPVADWFLPPDIHLAHLLVIPLALAAAFADTRRTAVTALLAWRRWSSREPSDAR